MKRVGLTVFLVLVLLAAGHGATWADTASPATPAKPRLVVGTAIVEPFSFKAADGRWVGITMELWDNMARHLGVEYEVREMTLSDLLHAVEQGQVDLAATALTVTADREKLLDFSQPYFLTGLGIATPAKAGASWLETIDRVLSSRPAEILLVVLACLLAAGLAIWLLERRKNCHQFGGSVWHGVGSGLWWAAQTMTSVGYGDKAPVTFTGRLLAVTWMLISLVLIASFTAVITTSLTVSHLGVTPRDTSELRDLRLGVVKDSASQAYLEGHRLGFTTYPGLDDLLRDLSAGRLDAVVSDRPSLRYLANHQFKGKIEVQRDNFQPGIFAFALPTQSPWRKPVNLALLAKLQEDAWRRILFRYLGDDPEIREVLQNR
ncbi:MAG: transporter substrate-binding domain-containing protein [Desulfarculus sp.]|nr:transporter substrate-binding domain-containing protein [Desulfarculus sp.]